MLERLGSHIQRKETDHYLIQYTESGLKTWMDTGSETINLPEENLGSQLLDISLGNGFLNLKARATIEKINKRDYIKLKSF